MTGLRPGPTQGHEWLQRELSKAEYHPSLRERLTGWLDDLLNSATPGTLSALGRVALVVLVVVLAVVVALVLSRLRRNPSLGKQHQTVFDDVRRTAEEHRRLARAAYDGGDWDGCVVEAMRALAAGLVERGVVADVPAATAREVTDLAQPRFPGLPLDDASRIFDETRYGGRTATREDIL